MTKKESALEEMAFSQWCLHNPLEFIGSLLTILLTGVVFLQVFYRYVLHSPLAWSEEFAMFIFQWCAYIGAAVAVRHRFHFGLDLVTKNLPSYMQRAAQILSSVLIFFVAYLMIQKGFGLMYLIMAQNYPVLQFPVAYAYLAIVVSGMLMIIFQIPIFLNQIGIFIKR